MGVVISFLGVVDEIEIEMDRLVVFVELRTKVCCGEPRKMIFTSCAATHEGSATQRNASLYSNRTSNLNLKGALFFAASHTLFPHHPIVCAVALRAKSAVQSLHQALHLPLPSKPSTAILFHLPSFQSATFGIFPKTTTITKNTTPKTTITPNNYNDNDNITPQKMNELETIGHVTVVDEDEGCAAMQRAWARALSKAREEVKARALVENEATTDSAQSRAAVAVAAVAAAEAAVVLVPAPFASSAKLLQSASPFSQCQDNDKDNGASVAPDEGKSMCVEGDVEVNVNAS